MWMDFETWNIKVTGLLEDGAGERPIGKEYQEKCY